MENAVPLILGDISRLLATEDVWSKGIMGRDPEGSRAFVTGKDSKARAFSLPGALNHVCWFWPESRGNIRQYGAAYRETEQLLSEICGRPYHEFDFAPETTFADIRRVIDEAKARAGVS
jgi:hypothetical protein